MNENKTSTNATPNPVKPVRLSDSTPGNIILGLLLAAFALLLTAATDMAWHSLFLPAIPLALALLLFVFSILKGYKIPQLNPVAWLTLAGAGYFLIRAWLSPGQFSKWADASLIISGCVFYFLGILAGLSKKQDKLLCYTVAFFLLAGAVVLFIQRIGGDYFTVLRPSFTILLEHVRNTGFFGYKNFMAHFLMTGGAFCCAYFIMKTKPSRLWLLVGLIALFASCWCGSRSVRLNLCVAAVIFWVLCLIKTRSQNTKFYGTFIAGIIALLVAGIGLVIALSQNPDLIKKANDEWISGNRFQLFGIALDAAREAPLFGHGSLSFEYQAMPSYTAAALPNMAHNEYAQALCDYGTIGLLILLALLVLHLVRGVRQTLAVGETGNPNAARLAASFTLLVIAALHATMEFIWHSPGIVAMGAFCAGIIAAGTPKEQKAGKLLNNGGLCLLALIGALFYSFIAWMAYPVWNNSWKINALRNKGTSTEIITILKDTVAQRQDPAVTQKYASLIAGNAFANRKISFEDLQFAEDSLRKSLAQSPNDYMTQTYLGIILSLQGQFEEADQILKPFLAKGSFRNNIFGWKNAYLMHLCLWADTIINTNPSKSLSLVNQALDIINSHYLLQDKRLNQKLLKELKGKLETERFLLHQKGITPEPTP